MQQKNIYQKILMIFYLISGAIPILILSLSDYSLKKIRNFQFVCERQMHL